MSVTSSRLRHQGVPGLQAQKCVSTENTTATAIVIGTTLVIVWPSISTTSRGRLDMSASSDQVASRVTCPCLRSDEAVAADAVACRCRYQQGARTTSHLCGLLNYKFTLLNNSHFDRSLRGRINCAAILRS